MTSLRRNSAMVADGVAEEEEYEAGGFVVGWRLVVCGVGVDCCWEVMEL